MDPEEPQSDEERAWAQAEARNRELGKEKMTLRGPKYFAVATQNANGDWVVEEREDKSEAGWMKSFFSGLWQGPWA